MWFLWLTLLPTFPMYREFLSSDVPGKDTMGNLNLFAASMFLGSIAVCLLIRWALIPRLHSTVTQFLPFLFGIFLATTICFFGIFFFVEFETLFFIASILSFLQFIPIYKTKQGQPKESS